MGNHTAVLTHTKWQLGKKFLKCWRKVMEQIRPSIQWISQSLKRTTAIPKRFGKSSEASAVLNAQCRWTTPEMIHRPTMTVLSIQGISSWQQFEIESLRAECHRRNKDFYVLPAATLSGEILEHFIHQIYDGFSCFAQAERIANEIKSLLPKHDCKCCMINSVSQYNSRQ